MNRKHIMAILALALCTVLCLAGASALTRHETKSGYECWEPAWKTIPEPDDNEHTGTIMPIEKADIGLEAPFEAQYLRTDGYHEGVKYPIVKIIRSVEELNKYYNANKGRYDMSAFPAACEKYDETYFRDHILVIVVTEAGSGSVRYQVTGVALDEDLLKVNIAVKAPEVGTCDMAQWHILIEPAAGVDVADETHVSVKLHAAGEKTDPDGGRDGFRTVTYQRDGITFSLCLPASWGYDVDEGREELDFAIRIGPKGHDAYPIVIGREKAPAFGTCGTGLEQKKIVIGPYQGWQGTYDGHPVWDFIVLGEMKPGRIVILNDGFDAAWWHRYGDEAMEILSGLTVSGSFILTTEEQALRYACSAVTVEYDYTGVVYDEETATWSVHFGREGVAGGDQTVTLDRYGNILDTTYGE